ncbi:MAG: type II CAAX endopeptidase family protein [Candidatus Faecousia sp.]|nr:type II CAAX endopeptidase family protein [Bacillota bacterium]MDY4218808.1 type II CAAX endopeptidase family protein [Candidatus Faecousia sp.]
MNETKRLSISMTRTERVAGWLYVPFYLILLAVLLTAVFQLLKLPTDTPRGSAMLNGVFFLINFLVTLAIYRRFLAKSLVQVGRRFWGFVQAVILGLVMYYAGTLLLSRLLDWLAPEFRNVNDASIQAMARSSPELMLVGTVLLAPLTEECILRGLIFQGLHHRSRIGAYVLSTLAFSFIHVYGYMGAYDPVTLLLCALEYLPAGIALAWAYEKADTIFAPVLMHCLINAVSFGLLV